MGWLMSVFARRKIYDDLSDEIEEHLPEKTDTLMAEGASREEAERVARREFGNVTRIKERSREPWRWSRAEILWADVRFALRKLGKSPGFTATAVSTLALGIGANVVVFSVLYGLVLRPLDVPQPKNLFQVTHEKWAVQSYRDYVDYRDRDPSFSGMMAYRRSALE
jgi:hypothetical protein